MSTITHIPTSQLNGGDTLLVGASMVTVETVKRDELDDDVCWITVTCISGNFDQFETPLRADAGDERRVLDADVR